MDSQDFAKLKEQIERMTPEERAKLKAQLLKPAKGTPVLKLKIYVQHYYKCQMCGNRFEREFLVDSNTPEYSERTFYLNSCPSCEDNLHLWDKDSLVEWIIRCNRTAVHDLKNFRPTPKIVPLDIAPRSYEEEEDANGENV